MANKLFDELMQLGHLLMQFYMYIEGANKLTMVMIIIETDLLSSFSNNSWRHWSDLDRFMAQRKCIQWSTS